jgi:hypothetical protein
MRLVYPGKDAQATRSLGSTFSRYVTQAYNPYEEVSRSNLGADMSSAYHPDPSFPVEAGYGGGLWTHQEISQEEKARLKELEEEEMMQPDAAVVNEEEMDIKDEKFAVSPPHRAPPSEDFPAPPAYMYAIHRGVPPL